MAGQTTVLIEFDKIVLKQWTEWYFFYIKINKKSWKSLPNKDKLNIPLIAICSWSGTIQWHYSHDNFRIY